jgi:chromosome segregation ATPase
MPQIFTLSGQDAIDFINKLAEQDAVDFVKALAAAAKPADVGKPNPDPTELELLSDENAALREALNRATADSQSAMRGALKELARLEALSKSRLATIESLRQSFAAGERQYQEEAKTLHANLVQAEAQRDAALKEVESVKQHLTDSGVEGLQARIDFLEKANDRLAESRHHLHAQLEQAKAQLTRLKPFLTEAVTQLTAARNDIN